METGEQEPPRAAPCGQYRRDWVLLAIGAVEPDLQEAMSVHLRECADCASSFIESEEVADAISTLVPDGVTPVLETLVAERAALVRRRAFRLPAPPAFVPWLLVAASAVCLLLVGHERDALLGDRAASQYFTSHDVGHVDLKSVHPELPEAAAHAVWSPESGLLFVADHLPVPPQDKCYQLWLLRRSHPPVSSAGMVRVGADGRAVLFVPPGEPLRDVTGLALTDEPAGGSVSSRGEKLLVGTR
jgi:hypothetical protein